MTILKKTLIMKAVKLFGGYPHWLPSRDYIKVKWCTLYMLHGTLYIMNEVCSNINVYIGVINMAEPALII